MIWFGVLIWGLVLMYALILWWITKAWHVKYVRDKNIAAARKFEGG